jgi:hypothetical protein
MADDISAPHLGTSLLDSTVAQFVSHPNAAGAGAFLKATGPLFSLALRDRRSTRCSI